MPASFDAFGFHVPLDLSGITVDAVTVLVGLFVVVMNIVMRAVRGRTPYISRNVCANDLLNGVNLVPFALMILSVFSHQYLEELIDSNRVLLATAGGVGGFFCLGEILKSGGMKGSD